MQTKINDEMRRGWVENDEGLYNLLCAGEHRDVRRFVKEHRAMIDEVINNVFSKRKPQHYLAYGA